MLLETHAVGVCPRGGDQEIQGLGAGVTRPFGHDVEQGPVWLGVQLIEDHPGDVEAVLGVRLSRQHLVEAIGGSSQTRVGGGGGASVSG